MTQDLHRWRHDLRSAINTMHEVAQLLGQTDPPDAQLVSLYVTALLKAGGRLEDLYDHLPEMCVPKTP